MGSLVSALKTPGLQGEHTALCQARVSYVYAGASLQAATSTEEGKLSQEAKLAKRSCLGLKRGRRLCASLPQRNGFHMPFPIFSSSI